MNERFYLWAGLPCRLVPCGIGVEAEMYKFNDFLPAEATQIERDGIPISEEEYRGRIRHEIMAQLSREKPDAPLPVVRIWAPDAQATSEYHDTMMAFARHRDFLAVIFQSQGVAVADILPPLPSLTWVPARDDMDGKYELIVDVALGHENWGVLRDFIYDGLGWLGCNLKPLTEQQLAHYAAEHRLTSI